MSGPMRVGTPVAPDTLRDVARSVATAGGYRLVVLFGSAARNETSPRDIDVAVLGVGPLDVIDATNRFMQALSPRPVDVVDLKRANPVLLMAVARDGIPLFDATGTEFNEFASLAMRRYADTKKFRDAVRDDLRNRSGVVEAVTPLDAAVVRRKARRILANVDTIERIVATADDASYAADEVLRRAVERLLQESIDAAVDVNNHLLRGAGHTAAEDYYTSFIALGAAGIVDAGLARSIAPAAGLRNRIVDEYEDLDARQVLAAAKRAPVQLRDYLRAIEQYLERQGL